LKNTGEICKKTTTVIIFDMNFNFDETSRPLIKVTKVSSKGKASRVVHFWWRNKVNILSKQARLLTIPENRCFIRNALVLMNILCNALFPEIEFWEEGRKKVNIFIVV
jgi:hypothetical protein